MVKTVISQSASRFKFVLCSQGSQGVLALIELFKLGIELKSIQVLTFEANFNKVFVDFIRFNKINYRVIHNNQDLEDVFIHHEYEVLISAGFRFIFTQRMLERIQIAAFNFHPGLLPNYKGSFSTAWSIINGERYVGYTYHFMERMVDSGNIILRKRIPIADKDTAHSLHYKIWQNGMSHLGSVIEKCLNGFKGERQEKKGTFYANKLPFNGLINPKWTELEVRRFISAMFFPPHDPARMIYKNESYYFSDIAEYKRFVENESISRGE